MKRLLLLCLFSGCFSTYATVADPKPYAGVRFINYHFPDDDTLINVWLVCDLPFSFVLDTVLLPYTIAVELSK